MNKQERFVRGKLSVALDLWLLALWSVPVVRTKGHSCASSCTVNQHSTSYPNCQSVCFCGEAQRSTTQ